MDALKDTDLVLAQPQGAAPALIPPLVGKVKVGDDDLFPLGELGKGLVQEGHIQTKRGFQVEIPLGGPGGSGRVPGNEVVVQGHRVTLYPTPLQLLLHLQGGGGLPRPGGAGEEDNGALRNAL